jgi:hypothetical protein
MPGNIDSIEGNGMIKFILKLKLISTSPLEKCAKVI